MLKVKDGYSKLVGNNQLGNINQILLSSGGTLDTSTFASSSHKHVWADITNRPTVVSAFTNDAGYLTRHLMLNHIEYADVRNKLINPNTYNKGIWPLFIANTTDGLNDGGDFHGVLHLRSYGMDADLSGGYPMQLAHTLNNTLWTRIGTSATTWGNWARIAKYTDIPTKLSDLTDDVVKNKYLPLTGGTLTGALNLAMGVDNKIGNNIAICSDSSNVLEIKGLNSNVLYNIIDFKNSSDSSLAKLMVDSSGVTINKMLTTYGETAISGTFGNILKVCSSSNTVMPVITFMVNDDVTGYLTIPTASAPLYRLTPDNKLIPILDSTNAYVINKYGYINGNRIDRVDISNKTYSMLNNYTAALSNLKFTLKEPCLRFYEALGANAVKNTPKVGEDSLNIHLGATSGSYEALLSFVSATESMYLRFGDNMATDDWTDWFEILGVNNYKKYIGETFTDFSNGTGNDIKKVLITIGATTKKLTIDYASSTTKLLDSGLLSNLNDAVNNATTAGFTYNTFNLNTTNIPSVVDNANGLITIAKGVHGSTKLYCNLILFLNSNDILIRYNSGTVTTTWVKLLTSANYSNVINKYISKITTSVNTLQYTLGSTTATMTISVNTVKTLGRLDAQTGKTLEYSGIYTYLINPYNRTDGLLYSNVIGFASNSSNISTVEIAGNYTNGNLWWRSLRDTIDDWYDWKALLDTSNYSSYITQLKSLGIGKAPESGYSLVTNSYIKAPALLIGNSVTDARIFAANTNEGFPTISSNTNSGNVTTLSGLFTFTFKDDALLSNSVTTTWSPGTNITIRGSLSQNNSTYTVSYTVNNNKIILYCTRTVPITALPALDLKLVAESVTIGVVYMQDLNATYTVSGNMSGSYLRASSSGAAIGFNNVAYIIDNMYSYDIGKSRRYMSVVDNLYQLPVFLDSCTITYNSTGSLGVLSLRSTYGSTNVATSGTRSSTGVYIITTRLLASKYTAASFIPIVNIYNSSNLPTKPLSSKVVCGTSGSYRTFTIYLQSGSTYTDSSCLLVLWYLP